MALWYWARGMPVTSLLGRAPQAGFRASGATQVAGIVEYVECYLVRISLS